MNDAMVLATEIAKQKLEYEWNDSSVGLAIENQSPRSFGNALRLFGGVMGAGVVSALELFDKAGMDKSEMARAIWNAARCHYSEKIKEKAVAE